MNITSINIVQIGCGGTGSYLVAPLSKYLRSLHKTQNYTLLQYILVDGDLVETKNIARQNFLEEDIDKNKATILANRYSDKSFKIYPFDDYLNTNTMQPLIYDSLDIDKNSLTLIIGCVDTISSRRNIIELLTSIRNIESNHILYIDSGNYLYNGQIKVFKLNKYIKRDFEEYFDDNYSIEMDKLKDSCSENGDQSILMNFRCADLLYSIITDIITRDGNCRVFELQTTRYILTPDIKNLTELIEEES